VVFTVAEDMIPQLMKQVHAGQTLKATAFDRTNTQQLAVGQLQSVDSQIDPTTGTIKLKAVFPNTDETLFPQQFVNVVLLLDTLHNATLVPQSAIQRGAPGTYLYVINSDSTVSVRKVTLGPGDANNVTIANGLKVGENVVTDGADRLKEGAKVLLPQRGSHGAGASAGAQGAGSPDQNQNPNAGKGQHRHRQQGQQASQGQSSQTGN
jgi:multidrug efflux system membrane fusion protein